MKNAALRRQRALGVIAALTAAFGVLAVSLSSIFDWKTVVAALATCPVGVIILWSSRDEPTLEERIEESDARRREQPARLVVLARSSEEPARAA